MPHVINSGRAGYYPRTSRLLAIRLSTRRELESCLECQRWQRERETRRDRFYSNTKGMHHLPTLAQDQPLHDLERGLKRKFHNVKLELYAL